MRSLHRVLLIASMLVMSSSVAGAQSLRFGGALAIGEGEVLVTEEANNLRPGTVYVFRRGPQGWQESAQLTAPDARVRDGFGASLALSGNTLFIGQAGTIHVYAREGADWRRTAAIAAPADAADAQFGAALAASGDWLLVGAPAVARGPAAGQTPRAGAVYAFRREGGGWAPQGRLTAAATAGGDNFGAALALRDGLALIGAPGAAERAGRAYLFRLDGAQGSWAPSAQLQASGAQPNEGFGAAVALGADMAVVGAPDQVGGGGAVVFRRTDGGEWVEHTRLAAFSGGRQDRFGAAVAVAGRDVWVGAPAQGLNTGRTYLFRGEGAGLDFAAARQVRLAETDPSDRFGQRLALGSDVALVAAPGKDHGAGVVAVYRRAAGGDWAEEAVLETEDEALDAVIGEEASCADDGRVGPFECGSVTLLSYLPPSMLTLPGENRGTRLNDMWGWTDEQSGREFAIVGRIDGTSFVDVTDPVNPVLIGDLPQTPGGPPSPTWRDMKVYRDHVFIVADAAGAHGMQVFDLTQLRSVRGAPVRFEPTALYTRINSAHNIVINEESGFAYVVGASAGGETCGGGLHMVDIRNPTEPQFAGCFADAQTGRRGTGYTHDAQCVMYRGPDERFHGREICIGSNENSISIADVTDKTNPVALSRAAYPNPAYTHQGWFTEDQRYFFVNDEGDEIAGTVDRTRTLVWDLGDLEDPRLATEFMGTTSASDHNLYIRDNLMFQSNYRAGLRIIDISDPVAPREVGYLDTAPFLEQAPGFSGTWSNYPFFRSGAIGVTSVHEGLFLVRYTPPSRPVM